MIGRILPEDKLYLRERVGHFDHNGTRYEMQRIVQTQSLVIENTETGKKFALSWEDIFGLALEAGIDKGENTQCTCPTKCDCQNPPTHISNECPVHNDNPYPSEDCPIHGEKEC